MKRISCAFILFLSLGIFFSLVGCGETAKGCNHEFSDWSLSGAYSCTEGGIEERICSKCNFKETRKAEALGHDWSAKKEVVEEATCLKKGLKAIVCKRCGETKEEKSIPLEDHSFGEWEIKTPATCMKAGEKQRVCSVCNATESKTIDASGHNFEDPNPDKVDCTCTEDGSITYHCQNAGCEQTKTEKIYTNGHVYKREILKEATCTEEGLAKDVCERGDDEKEVVLKALEHDMDTEYTIDTPPTATEKGTMSKHCKRPNCTERRDICEVGFETKLRYIVSVKRTNGAPAPTSMKLEIFDESGNLKETVTGSTLNVELTYGTYTAKISQLTENFTVEQSELTLTPQNRSGDFVLQAHIGEVVSGEKYYYDADNVIRNHKIHIVGSSADKDFDTSVNELLQQYKAIFINMYFTTCPPCMAEIQEMIDAYNTMSPHGKIYGEEVAMIMLPINETVDRVRTFKNKPSTYSRYVTSDSLPFLMAYQNDLLACLTTNSFPTNLVIDSEGVINFKQIGGLDRESFVYIMEEGALTFYYNLHPEEEKNSSQSAMPVAILPESKKYY